MVNHNQKYLSQHFLSIVVFLQIIMYISLFLNFPLARQVIGILYLTFIPGLVFIKLLKLDGLETLEFILFSVGFSVAFLMLSGLIINQFGPLVGLSLPLSILPLSLFINTIIIIGAAIAHLRQGNNKQHVRFQILSFHPLTLLLVLIPVLSIVGVYFVNTTGDSLVLLIMLLAIALLFAVSALYEKSTKFYPFAIFMIALALLFQVSLISNYILPYGGDSPVELYVSKSTQLKSQWSPLFSFPTDQGFGRFNAMLSVTILPTVYSNMLGMDPAWVFKIVFPLIFALVPIALYLLWQPYIGKKFAFLAAFLFMAQSTFYTEMVALNRQMIGELFFVLLLLVLLSKKIKFEGKFISFAILSFGLIFSHYALAEIFLFFIFAAWATAYWVLKKPSHNLQLSLIVFFFVAMFCWYIYTSGAVVFDSFLTFAGYVSSQLGDFFNPASRGQVVLTGLGLTQSPSILNTISRGFAYITELFIVIGVIALIRKKTHFRFERDFIVFGLVAMVFLVTLTIVPGLANTLTMSRFYHILLMMLAPFCIIGVWSFVKFIFKQEKTILVSLLVIAILVPYFLFQTNFAYEVAKTDSWSISLSKNRMNPMRLYGDFGYIESYSVYGAEWVSTNVPYKNNIVGDNGLFTALTAYGLIYRGYVGELKNDTIISPGEFAYLSYITVNYATMIPNNTLSTVFNQTDLVYSNGGSEIYCGPQG